MRRRSRSALGSRSVSVRRQEPPPTRRAESASLRTKRSARSGRASSASSRTLSARRSVSSFANRLGELERLGELGRRACARRTRASPAPRARASRPAGRRRPAARRPQPPEATRARRAGGRRARRAPRALACSSGSSSSGSGARNARRAPVVDHERLAWPSDVRRREGREPPLGRAGARIPARATAARARRSAASSAAVEALDAARLEVRATRPDGSTAMPASSSRRTISLPLLLGRRPGPARRARARDRWRAPPPSACPADPRRLGGRGHGAEQRLLARDRRERRRPHARARAGRAARPGGRSRG